MEQELLAVFNENHQKIGESPRSSVHQIGAWHETFHCWFARIVEGELFLYFQQRSIMKKDFPCLFDITAAGHLLANETVNDGIREVKEELGVELNINELKPIGILKDAILHGTMIDNEFAYTYVYQIEDGNVHFTLQDEEVSGVFSARVSEVEKLYGKEIESIALTNLQTGKETKATLKDFVPHGEGYMDKVLKAIRKLGEHHESN